MDKSKIYLLHCNVVKRRAIVISATSIMVRIGLLRSHVMLSGPVGPCFHHCKCI
jgi:hypothetical protein